MAAGIEEGLDAGTRAGPVGSLLSVSSKKEESTERNLGDVAGRARSEKLLLPFFFWREGDANVLAEEPFDFAGDPFRGEREDLCRGESIITADFRGFRRLGLCSKVDEGGERLVGGVCGTSRGERTLLSPEAGNLLASSLR